MRAVGNLAIPFPDTAIWRYDYSTDTVRYSNNLRVMLGRPKHWKPYRLTDLVEGARTNRHGDRPVRRFLQNPFLEIQENGFIKLTYFLNGKWFELKVWVTEHKRDIIGYEAKLELTSAPERPDTDELTGLPSRGLIMRLAADALADVSPKRVVAYFRLDMDGLRTINLYGHQAGDAALICLARSLCDVAEKWGEEVQVGRISGDEFVTIGVDLTMEQAERLSDDLIFATNKTIAVDNFGLDLKEDVPVTASIGMAIGDSSGISVLELDKQADLAQKWAKGHKSGDGTSRLWVYTDELAQRARLELRSIVDTRNALLDQEISPRYELLVDCGSRPVGVEALSRWHRSQQVIVPPEEYLKSLASLITDHDLQILFLAAKDVKAIQSQTGLDLVLHTNITPAALGAQDLPDRIAALLETAGFNPQQLVLEVVELSGMPDLATADGNFKKLSDLGIRFALDDYPTGMSSTLRLVELPYFQVVKFSGKLMEYVSMQPVLDENAERRRRAALSHLEAEVAMFHKLGIKVLAEHVTSIDVALYLESIGVDMMQGYLFGSDVLDEDAGLQASRTMSRDRIIRLITEFDSGDSLLQVLSAASG